MPRKSISSGINIGWQFASSFELLIWILNSLDAIFTCGLREARELGQIELKHSRLYPNPRIMIFCSTWCFNLQLDHIMLGESHEFPSLSVLFSLPYPAICMQKGLREVKCRSALGVKASKKVSALIPPNVTCTAANRTQIEWTKGGRWEFRPFVRHLLPRNSGSVESRARSASASLPLIMQKAYAIA